MKMFFLKARVILAGLLIVVGLALAGVAGVCGDLFSCLFWLGITAVFAGFPASKIIAATRSEK